MVCKVLLPEGWKHDPLSLFSLFFTDKIYNDLAKNTNKYAVIKRRQYTQLHPTGLQRPWKPCNSNEIRVLFGLWIYIGINKLPSSSDHWQRDFGGVRHRTARSRSKTWKDYRFRVLHDIGIRDLIRDSIGIVRYEQLKRYFHVSDPTLPRPNDHQWYTKLEPLSSELRESFQQYFIPGTKVSVDEMMIRFFGRSKHTIKIKNMPIKQGYKVWALSHKGYTYSYLYYSGVKGIGTAEIQLHNGMTATSSAVYHLARQLPFHKRRFDILMDNLFTNVPLFVELRSLGIGAAGTTRINAKGFPNSLKIEREKAKIVLPWGHLSGVVVEGVCCLVWQDNSSVFFMTSFHDIHQTVLRLRKRPKLSSTNGQVVRGVFGEKSRKALFIPAFIDDYNFNMGGVDIADQLRSYYLIQQIVRRNWLPYFFWLLDTAIVNTYQITRILLPTKSRQKTSHKRFRIRLARALIISGCTTMYSDPMSGENAENAENDKYADSYIPNRTISKHTTSRPTPVLFPPPAVHQLESRPTQSSCLFCRWNHKINLSWKIKKCYFGCKECNIVLCSSCFAPFHNFPICT